MIRYVVILTIVLFAGPLLAQDIIVHANIPVGSVTAEVRGMSAKEFKAWAVKKNEEAYKNAEFKHTAYLEQRGPLKTANVTESSYTNTTRYGGGYGASGLGGAGGYQGYGDRPSALFGVGYGNGYGGTTGLANSGSGASGYTFTGNQMQTKHTDSSKAYQIEYRDWNDDGGGPVEIINPFCYDFWQKHTQE